MPRPRLDHEAPDQIDRPRSMEEFVDFVIEQTFPGSDPPPFWCGGCSSKTFADED